MSVDKTLGEIHADLRAHGARSIQTDYDDEGVPVALSFWVQARLGLQEFRLPVHLDKLLVVLQRDHELTKARTRRRQPDREQAARVGWRLVRQWVAAQVAFLDAEMVGLDELFLQYAIMPGPDRRTLYDLVVEQRYQLPPPQGEAPNAQG